MKRKRFTLTSLPVTSYAAEGKALARIEGKVIFIEGAAPGDVVDVLITKNKKDWAEGRAVRFEKYSDERVTPFCMHFGVCGGCKWQMLPYHKQLEYKQQEVEQNLKRISKTELPPINPIIGSEATTHYRNKLEFTFSNRKYLSQEEIKTDVEIPKQNALGYHVPRIFDKIIDIQECFLMDEVNNDVRNTTRAYAIANEYEYYDIKEHTGFLRNIILRYCSTGELMVNLVVARDDQPEIKKIADHLLSSVPKITTLLYTINTKWNDSIHDLDPIVISGNGYVMEKLGKYDFKISPKSFFQTNTKQAEQLYTVAKEFAGLTGSEIVYDLYCGTGSIGIFVSEGASKIIGIEVIAQAIEDAKQNAAINNVSHSQFFTGDVVDLCNDAFFSEHGHPDVVITDPPRAGMHEKLVKKLIEISAPKIVYVSCNVATQARDISLLSEKYRVSRIQPVDMFPHTHHIECVALLELK